MSQRYYVVVGIDVPEDIAPKHERRAVEQLVTSLLRDDLYVRDIAVSVGGAIALSTDDVDRVILALRHEVMRGEDDLRTLDAKMTELRSAVDRVVARRKEGA